MEFEYSPIIAGIVIILIGFGLLNAYRKRLKKLAEAQFWARVPVCMDKVSKRGLGNKVVGAEGDGYRQYRVDVRYSYDVDGQSYDGNRIAYGSDIIIHKDIDRLMAMLDDDGLQVYYNPADPQESVLFLKHPSGKDKPELFFGIVMIILGVVIAVFNGGLHQYF